MHLNTGNCTPGNSLVSFVYGDITPGTLCPPVSLCSLVLGPPDQLSLWEFLTVILEVPWLSVFDPCALGTQLLLPWFIPHLLGAGGKVGGYIISIASCRRCLDYINGSFSLSLFPLSSFLSFCFVLYIFMLDAIPISQLILGDYQFLRGGV